MYVAIKILSVFFITAIILSQTINCDYCNQSIERSYVSFEGKNYHNECYENHIRIKCNYCGLAIDGKFIVSDNNKYHQKCFADHVQLRCDLCSGLIDGRYFSDYWGNKYHSYHLQNDAQCDYCGRFISAHLTKGGSKYNDGRVICKLCESTSIRNSYKAEDVFRNVRASLESSGIIIDYKRIELRLVDKNELEQITSKEEKSGDTRGFVQYTYYKSNGKITSRRFTVYLLSGMPQKDFEASAAHELMHVWQYLNCSDKLDLLLSEGSAEYAAFLHIRKYKDDYSKYILHNIENNKDAVYGEGFRRIKKYADQYSFDEMIRMLKRSNK